MKDVRKKLLTPGITLEGESVIVEMPEFLQGLGLADTLDNRAAAVAALKRAWLKMSGAGSTFEVRRRCPRCLGRGTVREFLESRITCRRCQGSGEVRCD